MSALIEKTCQYCQKTFYIYQSRTREGRGKFCSRACLYAYRRASREATCQQCGQTYSARPVRLEKGITKFCSRKCHDLSRRRTLAEYFWEYVEKTDTCWWWTGIIHSNGYGRFWLNDTRFYAHRVSYELNCGPIPPGYFVCHHCDNPLCVRPDHLFLGTPQENVADSVAKGRSARGEKNAHTKLTEEDVIAIRETYAAGGITHRELAHQYNVSRKSIGDIINRRRWKHVP